MCGHTDRVETSSLLCCAQQIGKMIMKSYGGLSSSSTMYSPLRQFQVKMREAAGWPDFADPSLLGTLHYK